MRTVLLLFFCLFLPGRALAFSVDSGQTGWHGALEQLNNGSPFNGARLMDSLARTDMAESPLFWKEYLDGILKGFWPKTESQANLPSLFTASLDSTAPGTTTTSWNLPQLCRWKSEVQQEEKIPRYIVQLKTRYTRKWDKKQVPLGQCAVVNSPEFQVPTFLSGMLANKMFFDENESRITLLLDPNHSQGSLEEVMRNGIAGLFDSISVSDEFLARQAVSVKCFQRGAPANRQGGYCWVVGFDRFFKAPHQFKNEPSSRQSMPRVRYLLALSATKNDRVAADSQFVALLNAFLPN